jgi:hypothetical protein
MIHWGAFFTVTYFSFLLVVIYTLICGESDFHRNGIIGNSLIRTYVLMVYYCTRSNGFLNFEIFLVFDPRSQAGSIAF